MDFVLECCCCGRTGQFNVVDGYYDRVWCVCGVNVRGSRANEMVHHELLYHGRSCAFRKAQSAPEVAEPPLPPIWEFRFKPKD